MARFTKELRQEIVREFATRHNGQFDPALFLDEVREKGSGHPAYEWFDWDDALAAHEYRLSQAREFARDLKVSFTVENVSRDRPVTVRHVEMPMVISPVEQRPKGGGYVVTQPEAPSHQREFCRQAASDLRAWLKRYDAAIHYAAVPSAMIEAAAIKLEKVAAEGGEE